MRRKKGRPRLGDSETKIRTYSISERQFKEFKEWCKDRGFKVSEVIRVAIGHLMKEGRLEDLLQDEEMRNLAVELLNKQFERSVIRNEQV